MSKLIVIGSLNMDLVTVVDRHPQVGETIFGHGLDYFPGGKGANQAIAASRLGASTQLVGCVGNDSFGQQLRDVQQAEGIDTHCLQTLSDTSTGTAIITVAANGANHIVVNTGANAALFTESLDSVDINPGDIVLAQLEVPFDTVLGAFQKAKLAGARTILNPSPVSVFHRDIVPLTDILVLNEIELGDISGLKMADADSESIAHAEQIIVALGCHTLVTTLGEHGIRLYQNGDITHIAGRMVKAVDTTGAGDCFTGAMAAALLGGKALAAAAEFGNAAAAISVTRRGAASSMPLLSEIK